MAEGIKDVKATFRLVVDDKGFQKADASIAGVKAASEKATAAAERRLTLLHIKALEINKKFDAQLGKVADGAAKHTGSMAHAIEGLSQHLSGIGAKFGMAGAGEGLEKLSGIFAKVTAGLPGAAAGFVAVGAILLGLGEKTANHANEMKKSAEIASVDLQVFQELAFAAKESGVETDKLTDGLTELSKKVHEAMKGKGDAAKDFRDLGIAFKGADGKARPLTAIMADIADKTQAMGKSTERAAKLQGVLGKSAKDYIPWLAKGSGEMKHATEMARKYGIVLSEETIRDASKYSKSKKQIAAVFEGLELQLGSMVVPHIASIAKGIAEWTDKARPFLKLGLEHYMNEAIAGFKIVGTVLDAVGTAVGNIHSSLKSLASMGGEGGVLAGIFDSFVNPLQTSLDLIDEIRRIMVGEASEFGYMRAVSQGKGEEYLKHAEAGGKFKSITGEIIREPTKYKRGMDVDKLNAKNWEEADWMGKIGMAFGTKHRALTNMQQSEIDKRLGSFRQSYGRAPTEQEYEGIKADADYAYRKQLADATAGGMRGGPGSGTMIPGLPMPEVPWSPMEPSVPASMVGRTTNNVAVAPTTVTINASTVDADSFKALQSDVMTTVMREAAMSLSE